MVFTEMEFHLRAVQQLASRRGEDSVVRTHLEVL